MLRLMICSGLVPSFPVMRSAPNDMFALTFSATILSASLTAEGPPKANAPIRMAMTIFDSAASAHASMLMLNQLGDVDLLFML